MARPIRNNATYFPHQANFRNDRRVKAIRARFGPQGYAILIMLMEALTDADYTFLFIDELEMELLAGDFGVSVTEIHSLLQIAEKIGLFSRNSDGNLICEELNQGLEQVFEKRNRSRSVAQSAPKKVSVTETPVSVTESTQIKEEEIKEEKKTSSTSTAREENGLDQPSITTNPVKDPSDPPLNKSSGDSYYHFNIQLKAEAQFRDSTCMSLKIKPPDLPGLIDQFTHEQRAVGKVYPDFIEFKKHCFNWLRIEATKPHGNQRPTPALYPAKSTATGPRASFGQGADLNGIVYEQESFK